MKESLKMGLKGKSTCTFYTQHTPVSHLAFPSYLKNCFLVTSSGNKTQGNKA